MTFRLDLANRTGLFQRYASWLEDSNILDSSHTTFTFGISYLINSIENINKYKAECLDQYGEFDTEIDTSIKEVNFQTPSLFNLFSEISISLTQIRSLQDTLLNLISKKLKISIAPSMNSYAAKKNKVFKTDLEKSLHAEICDYWEMSGLAVKHYRDLDQHYCHLFEYALITKHASGTELELRLPDNPLSNKRASFTYLKKIDAIKFIQNSFSDFHRLVDNLCKVLHYEERLFDLNIAISGSDGTYLTVTFDPYQNNLIGTNVCISNNKANWHVHHRAVDLDNYSFINLPTYFNVKNLPTKDLQKSGVFDLEPSTRNEEQT